MRSCRLILVEGASLLAIVSASGVSAQQAATSAPNASAGTSVEQIATDEVGVSVQQVGRPRSTNGVDAPGGVLGTTRQIGRAKDLTTQPPSGGIARADGRPVASTAIGGSDRCDPDDRATTRRGVCAQPIETRAGEFRRSPPALSPEQRLAITRETGDAAGTTRELTRLGRGVDPDAVTTTDQGVAARALRDAASATAATGTEAASPAAVDPGVVDAIIQIIGQPTTTPR